jgi:competence protein ComEC
VTDRAVVVMAAATVVGAWWARGVPGSVVVAVVVAAWAARRPFLWIVAVAMVASVLGARAEAGVRHAPTRGAVEAPATLVGDPEEVQGAIRVAVRLPGGRRVEAYARGGPAAALRDRLAGEHVRLSGSLAPVSGPTSAYLRRRHIGARLTVHAAVAVDAGSAVTRVANGLRRTLDSGAATLGPRRRALFTGLVIGDDRNQAPEEVDDFRAAGLTHLLAVSGENVAFVLALAGPVLRRLGLRARLVAGVAVLVVFGVITRWEPSVLRAIGMGAISMGAATAGRPIGPVRLLALAVTALVLVDPMLAGAVGFLLSVGACAGIALLGPPLQRRMPAPLAITLAAQVGVAPVLLPVFGSIPSASIPANLLAVPVAGPVMVWGIAAGLAAGVLGPPVAGVLHLPTRVLLWWIAGVAHAAARAPLPVLGPRACLLLAGGTATAVGAAAIAHRMDALLRLAPPLIATALVVPPIVGVARPPATADAGTAIARGVRVWRADGAGVVVVSAAPPTPALLAGVRSHHVDHADLLVVTSTARTTEQTATLLQRRMPVRATLTPTTARPGVARVGPFTVTITVSPGRTGARLGVVVGSPGAPRARPP